MTEQQIAELRSIVGPDNVLTGKADLLCYGYDATIVEHLPEAVIYPHSVEEISQVMQFANRELVPVTPRGAGSGLSGGSVPTEGGLVMVITDLNRIKEVNTDDLYLVCESGAITIDVDNAVKPFGLMYPPDPSSNATSTIAGNIAEDAGGLRGLKYGVTHDYVLELEVVVPTGEIIRCGSKAVKSVSGYNLQQLMVGSEGTLGIITEASLNLLPLPKHTESMLAVFETAEAAGMAVAAIIKAGIIPCTLELLDNATINAIENFKSCGLPTDAGAVLLIEADGVKEAAIQEAAEIIGVCKNSGAREVRKAETAAERDALWSGRRTALSALANLRPTVVLEDATVRRSRIPAMLRAVDEIAKKYNVQVGTFGHAGDGNLHPTFLTDVRDKEEFSRVEAAIDELFEAAMKLEGTISGEHGIGVMKKKYLPMEFSPATLATFKRVRQALDPKGIMNPGKLID